MADGAYTLKRFDEIRTKMLGDTEHPEEIGQRLQPKEFLRDSEESAFVLLKDNITERPTEKTITFMTAPQPQFNKKFELLAEDIPDTSGAGIRDLFPDGEQGPDRTARKYFQFDRRETHSFGSVPITLHAGFIDHVTRKCFYTDHQIFDRYQRYRIGASSIGVKALPFRSSIR